jgi:poly-gamma-glutamate synthesis protein (capsule biosynthesis protein)
VALTPPLRILAVGDVLVDRDDPASAFSPIKACLDDADFRFGNCETPYCDVAHPPPATHYSVTAPAANATALGYAGFDAMSCANNHILDGGHEAMLETAQRLRENGVAPVGVGGDIDEAWEPAVVTVNGKSIATVAFASFFPYGGEARENWPGLAPVRAHSLYLDAVPNNWAPGAMPLIRSYPEEGDVEALKVSIARARDLADVVLVSAHWGDWTRAGHLTDHEVTIGRLAIDAGADMVLGHHHHLIRGVEWYHGKPIFYGLGQIVFDLQRLTDSVGPHTFPTIAADEPDDYFGIAIREGWPRLPLHPDSRRTMIAWAELDPDGEWRIGVLPCWLNPQGQPIPYSADSPEGEAVLAYLRWACEFTPSPVEIRESTVTLGGLRCAEIVDAAQGQ